MSPWPLTGSTTEQVVQRISTDCLAFRGCVFLNFRVVAETVYFMVIMAASQKEMGEFY